MFFYAVAVGFQPGVYRTWKECQKQVETYETVYKVRARYKKFGTEQEAIDFVKNPGGGPVQVTEAWVAVGRRTGKGSVKVYLLGQKPETLWSQEQAPYANYFLEKSEKTEGEPPKALAFSTVPGPEVPRTCLELAGKAKKDHGAKKVYFCHDTGASQAWKTLMAHRRSKGKVLLDSSGKPLTQTPELKALDGLEVALDEHGSLFLDRTKVDRLKRKRETELEGLPDFLSFADRGIYKADPTGLPDNPEDPEYLSGPEFAAWLAREKKRFLDWLGPLSPEVRDKLYRQISQKTEDWLGARQYPITATAAEVATGSSPYKTRESYVTDKTWPGLRVKNTSAELARLELGEAREDEARDAGLALAKDFYEGAPVRFLDRLFGQTVQGMESSCFVGGIYFSDKEEQKHMACSDDGVVQAMEKRPEKDLNFAYLMECKVPGKGYYEDGLPPYYRDQVQYILGFRKEDSNLGFGHFTVLNSGQGKVSVRRVLPDPARFRFIELSCKSLHDEFCESLVLRSAGLSRYPETKLSQVLARLKSKRNQ